MLSSMVSATFWQMRKVLIMTAREYVFKTLWSGGVDEVLCDSEV